MFSESLDRLSEVDPSALADRESVIALNRDLARMEAIVAQATAAFDTSGDWALDGAQTAATWITARCLVKKSQAKRLVHRGRALRCLPETERAWASGKITGDHVDVLAALRRDGTEEVLARDEAFLVDQATKLPFAQFGRITAYWMQRADPEGTEKDAERLRARREVYLVPSFGGAWLGSMTLDPIEGTIVAEELARLEHELFEADRAEAKAALGRDPGPGDRLARTTKQRRADALVEMARRSAGFPADGRKPDPLFTILVDYETLHGTICETEDGTVIPPGSLLPWLDSADLQRAVFTPGERVEIGCTTRLFTGATRRATGADLERAVFAPRRRAEISPKTRLFTGATRRAIEVRDQRCTHPFCDQPASSTEVDHIQPWALGGLTTQENGRLLCRFHNRLRNQRPPPAPTA